MKNKKIHILGGSGFIGTHLIEILKNDYDLLNMDLRISNVNPSITRINDICNFNAKDINLKKNDVVILLAAEHSDDVNPSEKYYITNVNGTKNVLDQMESVGCKNLIFTSSVAVYGLNQKNPNENSIAQPFNHYSKSKLKAENIIKKWSKSGNKKITIIRPTVVFGENNRGNVYNFLKQIDNRRFIMVGTGENRKSISYVKNLVYFIKDRLENEKNGLHIYNYADKPDLSMNDLVRLVEHRLGKKIPNFRIPFSIALFIGYFFDIMSWILKRKFTISSIRIKKFVANTNYCNKKISIFFNPPFEVEDGLRNTIDYEFLDKN